MQKIAKPGEAPNYHPAENSNASCQSCFYFGKYANGSGYCNQYKFSCREAFTCDGFTPSAQKSASFVEGGDFLGGKYESKEAHITLLTGSSGSGKSTLADKLKDNYDMVVGTDTGGVVNGKYVALPKEQQQKLRQERTEAILAAHRQGKRVLVEGYPEGQFKHPGVVQHAERVLFLDTSHIRGLLDVGRRSFQRGTPLLPDLKMAIETRFADRKPLKLLEQQVGKDNFIRIRRDYAEKKATTPAHIFVTGHSGAGKTTKAHELAKQTGMPILALDDTPEISDYHRRQKAYSERTGQFEMLADEEKEALSAVMKRIAALKEPHIVEGAHFLAAPHMLPYAAHVVLVDRPKEQILQQRVEREEAKRKLAGKPSDPDGTRARGEMLHDYYAPGFAVVAARPTTKTAAISGSKEDVRSGKKVDAFFLSAEPKKKWDEFKENVERRSFVQRILADPRTDQKLLLHADSMNRLATGQRLGVVPGANGETYEIKRLRGSGEIGCTCADWRYKKSVAPSGDRECKHIRIFRGQGTKLASLRKEAIVPPEFLHGIQHGAEAIAHHGADALHHVLPILKANAAHAGQAIQHGAQVVGQHLGTAAHAVGQGAQQGWQGLRAGFRAMEDHPGVVAAAIAKAHAMHRWGRDLPFLRKAFRPLYTGAAYAGQRAGMMNEVPVRQGLRTTAAILEGGAANSMYEHGYQTGQYARLKGLKTNEDLQRQVAAARSHLNEAERMHTSAANRVPGQEGAPQLAGPPPTGKEKFQNMLGAVRDTFSEGSPDNIYSSGRGVLNFAEDATRPTLTNRLTRLGLQTTASPRQLPAALQEFRATAPTTPIKQRLIESARGVGKDLKEEVKYAPKWLNDRFTDSLKQLPAGARLHSDPYPVTPERVFTGRGPTIHQPQPTIGGPVAAGQPPVVRMQNRAD